jgi:hypothetical protein
VKKQSERPHRRADLLTIRLIGEILADHAIDGSTRHPIGLFFPDRLAARE